MKQAQNVRRNGGEIFVAGSSSQKNAKQIEAGLKKEGKQMRHDPHGEGMNPHFQTEGVQGHTFYGGILFFMAPNTMDLSGSACTTDFQFGSALLWDGASMLDPIGVTNAIDAYTGLDGGGGGFSGLRQLVIDSSPLLIPIDVGTKQLGELVYGQ